jgi:hypothetical protein
VIYRLIATEPAARDSLNRRNDAANVEDPRLAPLLL